MPHTWFALIELLFLLIECQFRVIHEEAITDWKNISAGVLQGSVLEHILYLIYTVDISTNNYSMTAIFADDTAILTTDEEQQTVTD